MHTTTITGAFLLILGLTSCAQEPPGKALTHLAAERQIQVYGAEAQGFIDFLFQNHVSREPRGPNLVHLAVDRVDCDQNPATQPLPICQVTYFGRPARASPETAQPLYIWIINHGGARPGPAPGEVLATAIGIDCMSTLIGAASASYCTMLIEAGS